MKKAALALIALATTVGFAHAGPKEFDQREHPNRVEKFIQAADLNNDHAVTKDEYKAFLTKKSDEHFSKLDGNGDGSISKEEFMSGPFAERVDQSFKRFDVNSDDKIDLTDKAEAVHGIRKHLGDHRAPPQPDDLDGEGPPAAE